MWRALFSWQFLSVSSPFCEWFRVPQPGSSHRARGSCGAFAVNLTVSIRPELVPLSATGLSEPLSCFPDFVNLVHDFRLSIRLVVFDKFGSSAPSLLARGFRPMLPVFAPFFIDSVLRLCRSVKHSRFSLSPRLPHGPFSLTVQGALTFEATATRCARHCRRNHAPRFHCRSLKILFLFPVPPPHRPYTPVRPR